MTQELELIRSEIDALDSELIRLISKRLEYAVRTKKLKSELTDEAREKDVLRLAQKNARWLVTPEFSQEILTKVMAESRNLQARNLSLFGFVGSHGSLAEGCLADSTSPSDAVSSEQSIKSSVPISFHSNQDLFQELENGTIDFGIIPFERVCDASMSEPLDLLLDSDLIILADVITHPSYALMTLPEADYREIKIVYGHPEILARSKDFIARTKLQIHPYHDSAAAALMLKKDRPLAAGVIAPLVCADIYNLQLLKNEVDETNYDDARFLIIGKSGSDWKSASTKAAQKTMLYFSTSHTSGTLSEVLDLFSESKINLLKIESLPTRSASSVPFLLEFDGGQNESAVKAVFTALAKQKIHYKVLGSYGTAAAATETGRAT